jgi:hypothetical protein
MKSDINIHSTVTYTLHKILAFPPAKRLWALEPSFQICAAQEGKARIDAFSFVFCTFAFSRSFFRAPTVFLF